jgi:hypothetical protein
LQKNSLEGVEAVEVLATSLEPEVVEQEAPKDVEGLTKVCKATRMVAVQIWGVVVGFEDGFPEEDEGPVDVEAVGRPPFDPNTAEGLPSLLSRDAFHEAVLGRFLESLVTDFTCGRDSHDLELGPNWQPVAEDQPGKSPDLAWTGVVPHPGNDLGDRRAPEV